MKDALYIIFYPHPLAFREHPSHQYPKSSPSPGPPWLHIARWPAKALSVPVVRSASWRSWLSCSLLCTAVWTPVQRGPNPMVDHFLLSVNSFHSLLSFPILFTPSVDKATPFPLLVTLAQDSAGSWGLLESHCFDNHRVKRWCFLATAVYPSSWLLSPMTYNRFFATVSHLQAVGSSFFHSMCRMSFKKNMNLKQTTV